MGVSQQKSVFPVVTYTMTAIALLGLSCQALRPLAPKVVRNTFVANEEDFLLAGQTQNILWHEMGPEVFRLARQLDKPIFMLIGNSCSASGREADEKAFTGREIYEELQANYVCVRVDVGQYPSWGANFNMFSRASFAVDPYFQIRVLDPGGRLIATFGDGSPDSRFDNRWLNLFLKRLRDIVSENQSEEGTAPQESIEEDKQMQWLSSTDSQPLNIQRLSDEVTFDLNRRWQTPDYRGYRRLPSTAIQFLHRIGQHQVAMGELDRVLKTPIVDWVDGGFFRQGSRWDFGLVETDKIAVRNAEMAKVLAQAYVRTGRNVYRRLAVMTVDALLHDFAKGRSIRAFRIGLATELGRNPRCSFPPKLLRENLTEDERQFVRTHFGLRVETNPQMIIQLPDIDLLDSKDEPTRLQATKLLGKLRTLGQANEVTYGEVDQLDVTAFSLARILETCRLLELPEEEATAFRFIDNLGPFEVMSGDVIHSLRQGNGDYAELGDYLCYADLMLQYYRATGWDDALRRGSMRLVRALDRFADTHSGVLLDAVSPDKALWPKSYPRPSVLDTFRESNSAMAIRLCTQYSQVLKSLEKSPLGDKQISVLTRFASDSVDRFQPVMENYLSSLEVERRKDASLPIDRLPGLGIDGAGLMVASIDERTGYGWIVVGPTAIADAKVLERVSPESFVVPVALPRREGYSDLASGVYGISDGKVTQKLTLSEAISALSGK